ncbi:MAG: heme-copper oxidase subunit III [Terriglobales bacterium]
MAPPPRDGGWGGGRPDDHRDRLRRYRIGMFFALTAVVMLFVSFTSAYIVRQGVGTWSDASARYVTDWQPISLPPILWINTVILLLSSFTLAMAQRTLSRKLRTAPRGGTLTMPEPMLIVDGRRSIPWLGITVVLGAGFLVGQLLAWEQLRRLGIFVSTNPSSSFFYVLTGTHGIHLLGGVLALGYAGMTSLLRKPLATRFLVVDVTALYWHFMDFLWIYIFALLHFAR